MGIEDSSYQVKVKLADPSQNPESPEFFVKRFEDIGLPEVLLKNLYAMNFSKPSKIQERALALLLSNPPCNLVAQSQSGTGKTAAFVLNILVRIDPNLKKPQAICLSPSRELAKQICEVFQLMSKDMNIGVQLVTRDSIERGSGAISAPIVVGTPGSLTDNIKRRILPVEEVKIYVLDEADNMLNQQGLGDQSIRIRRQLPQSCQICLFSATFPGTVRQYAQTFAPKANEITLEEEQLQVEAIKQYYIDCRGSGDKYEILCNLYALMTIGQSIIFVHRRQDADDIAKRMTEQGHKVVSLHGGLESAERDVVMGSFRSGESKVLIATNVISRGIDVPQVNMVINYDMPLDGNREPDCETYLHRIGRTGRFGKTGASVNFVHNARSWEVMNHIVNNYKMTIKQLNINDWDDMEKVLKEANN